MTTSKLFNTEKASIIYQNLLAVLVEETNIFSTIHYNKVQVFHLTALTEFDLFMVDLSTDQLIDYSKPGAEILDVKALESDISEMEIADNRHLFLHLLHKGSHGLGIVITISDSSTKPDLNQLTLDINNPSK